MEIDVTSIIIGIAALSTFIIPIGIHEYSQKNKVKKTRRAFYDAAKVNNLHIDDMEVLRNGYAIGIDVGNHNILHLIDQVTTVTDLNDVLSFKLFKNLRGETMGDGTKTYSVIMGIQITSKHNRNQEIKLPFFKEIEGSLMGDEEITIRRWLDKIHLALKKM